MLGLKLIRGSKRGPRNLQHVSATEQSLRLMKNYLRILLYNVFLCPNTEPCSKPAPSVLYPVYTGKNTELAWRQLGRGAAENILCPDVQWTRVHLSVGNCCQQKYKKNTWESVLS